MSAPTMGYAGTPYEPTWTTKQVAEFLGLAVQTVYNLRSAGEPDFPRPRKQGRLNAFIPSEVAAYRAKVLNIQDEGVTR
ncbi:helix-turn-helix transcriptional regulator [Leucobacter soli]|uniref:Helix-turn-helix domain-containing protein n=1 Tax=Leucobacter soli TaxID=2812850 RepID=A0A916K1H1_9MICO|nr:helix-turn-helix domain-containing protein [Leucobacter soli]CAG7622384.1 hypothetical protein LEUCIP111803_02511 [Leucobacter soli]